MNSPDASKLKNSYVWTKRSVGIPNSFRNLTLKHSQDPPMAHASRFLYLAAIVLLAALLQSCDSADKRQSDGSAAAPTSISQLMNMAYDGFDVSEGPIVLSDGIWEGEPYEEGAAVRPRITFAGDFRLDGDLDGDGMQESAVLLNLSSGGSGQLLHLCIVGIEKGRPVNLATALIGDRVQIRNAKIIDNHIMLDIVEAGPDDPACCPGQLSTYGWTYTADGTLQRSTLNETPGRMTLGMLEGQEWVLRFWDHGETAPMKPVVILSYAEGRFTGSGGCNRFFASVSERISAGDIALGPIGSTQMACPEEEMRVEGRFLANLGGVTKFGFMLGRLALTYQSEGEVKSMLFERR